MQTENSGFGPISGPVASGERVVEVESSGATSRVFRVLSHGTWMFVKRPKDELRTHPKYLAAFEKEFELGIGLDHPNIVQYLSKGYDEAGVYLTMRYVDGRTLAQAVAESPSHFQESGRLEKLAEQLLSALGYLHGKQILHLDLKPENVMLTRVGGDVKLLDFGFAYQDGFQYLTVGRTAKYAAPEQLANGELTAATDLYAFGRLLLFAYCGSADDAGVERLPRRFRKAVRMCLRTDPQQRPQSAADVLAMLQPQRRKWHLWLLLPLLAAAVAIPWMRREQPAQTEPATAPRQKDTLVVRQVVERQALSLPQTAAPATAAKPAKEELAEPAYEDDAVNYEKICQETFAPLLSAYYSYPFSHHTKAEADSVYRQAMQQVEAQRPVLQKAFKGSRADWFVQMAIDDAKRDVKAYYDNMFAPYFKK